MLEMGHNASVWIVMVSINCQLGTPNAWWSSVPNTPVLSKVQEPTANWAGIRMRKR